MSAAQAADQGEAVLNEDSWEQIQQAGAWPTEQTASSKPVQAYPILSEAGLLELPRPSWLVEGLIVENSLTVLYGPPAAGKSFIALSMAKSIQTGIPFLGFGITKSVPVLYIAAEGALSLAPRIEAWNQHHSPSGDQTAINLLDRSVPLNHQRAVSQIIATTKEADAKFVVFDTLARCAPGIDENTSKDIGGIIQAVDAIRTETGAAVMLVHHSGKDPAGARALALLAADTEIQCHNGRLKNTKQRSAEEVTPVHFALEEVAGSVVPVETHKTQQAHSKEDQVLWALQNAYEVQGPVTSNSGAGGRKGRWPHRTSTAGNNCSFGKPSSRLARARTNASPQLRQPSLPRAPAGRLTVSARQISVASRPTIPERLGRYSRAPTQQRKRRGAALAKLAEIEERLAELDVAAGQDLIFDLLSAYGFPQASITRLRSGDHNRAGDHNTVLWKKKIWDTFDANATEEELLALLDRAQSNGDIRKLKPRFLVARNDTRMAAIDTRTGQTLDAPLNDLVRHAAFFMPWAGTEQVRTETPSYVDIKVAQQMAKLYDEIIATNRAANQCGGAPQSQYVLQPLAVLFLRRRHRRILGRLFHVVTDQRQATAPYGSPSINCSDPRYPTRRACRYACTLRALRIRERESLDIELRPQLSRRARNIVDCGTLDWNSINPDIFGSMIQAVAGGETELRSNAHTSVENILRVLNPLFLDDLEEPYDAAEDSVRKLGELLDHLGDIRVFDPACGSGNFLIVATNDSSLRTPNPPTPRRAR